MKLITFLLIPFILSSCFMTLSYEEDGRKFEVGWDVPKRSTGKNTVRTATK